MGVLPGLYWQTTFVNFDASRTTGSGSRDEAGKSFSWTTFETSGPVAVRARRIEGSFDSVQLRPARYGLSARRVSADTVEFTASPGQKISVEFDTEIKDSCYTGPPHGIPCIKDALLVFADPVDTESPVDGVPDEEIHRVAPGSHEEIVPVSGGTGLSAGRSSLGDCGGKRIVVFPPGVYDIGYWQVPNNIQHVHLEGGAYVFGAIDVIPQGRSPFYDASTIDHVYRDDWRGETLLERFSLTGAGVISGAKLPWHLKKDFSYTSGDDWWAHLKVFQLALEQVLVEDVTIANSPHWVLSFINDADRRTRGRFNNFKMVGAWTYNNDGLPNPTGEDGRIANCFIHADDDAFKIYNSGSSIDNCVVWQSNNGAVFQFGWYPKTVSGVRVSNIDVIHFENWYGVGQSNRAVFNYANSGGNGTISDIVFDDVRVEGPILRLFGFNCFGGQVVRGLTFNHLSVPGGMGIGNLGSPGANYFIGQISDFTFNNFTFGDSRVTSPEDARFDFGNGAGAGFVFTATGPPIANAGPDRVITLPTTSVVIDGSAVDHDGKVEAYDWTQVSGPADASLSGQSTEDLTASDLVVGTYVFRLSVRDDEGQVDHDDMSVRVNPEPPPTPPVADAGADQVIVLPRSTASLSGTATDVGGSIERYEWKQVDGPTTALIQPGSAGLATASELTEGEYVFRLTVTDDDGMKASDDTTVSVLPKGAVVGREVLWDRGAGTSRLTNATNWGGDELPGPSDVAVLRAPGVTDSNYNLGSDSITWGALKVSENQSGFWNFNASGGANAGALALRGRDVGSFEHAAIVNHSGNGGGIRSDLTLSGGGTFVIAHNAGSGLEIDGVLGEAGGAASLVVDGNGIRGLGQSRVHVRGSNTAERCYQLSGSISLRNGANLRVEDGFDISQSGGTITVDGTSRWNLGPSVRYTVAGLTVNGIQFAPGTYAKKDFDSKGVGENFENSGATIVVADLKNKQTAFLRGDAT
ncbi:MAG: hypothetical protein AAF517_20080, partial [Planctomycetota bacterium]